MADKIYVKWMAKEKTFDNGGSIIRLALNMEQLKWLEVDSYWNIKLDVCKRKTVWEYGDTHYVTVNDYKKPDWETWNNKKENWWWDSSTDLPF